MTLFGLVLDVSGVDGDTTFLFFRSLIDGSVISVRSLAGESQVLGDSSSQGGLAVVDVTDGADIYMGFATVKLLLCHNNFLLKCRNQTIRLE